MKRGLVALALTGVVLLLALATGFSLLYRLFYALSITVAGSYLWAWLNLRWLDVRVERRASQVHVGGHLVERITVQNKGWLPKPWLEVVELADLQGHEPGMTVSLASGAFRSWRTVTPCRRRGMYTLGPLRLATGDPFGLFRLQRHIPTTQPLKVLPAVVPLPHFVLPAAELPGEGPRRPRSHQVTSDAATVRDYAPGDSVRQVHWPTSARLARLMVKEFDPGFTSEVWVLVDLEEGVQAQRGAEATDELAVTVAASVARRLLSLRLAVGIAASSERFALVPPNRDDGHFGRLLELLAQLQADGTVPLAEAIARLEPKLSRHTTLVVITPSLDPRWIAAMDTLRKRRVRLVAVLIDASTFGGSGGPELVRPALAEQGVLSYVVKNGDNLGSALAAPYASWDGGPAGLGRRRGPLTGKVLA